MTDSDRRPTRPAPPRAYRWLVLVFISLAMFGNYYVYDCISPMADVLKAKLGFSDANIGLLQAIYSIPNIVMVLIGGVHHRPHRHQRTGASLAVRRRCCLGRARLLDRALLGRRSPIAWPPAAWSSAWAPSR